MKSNDKLRGLPSIVEDGAVEGLKKRARDLGLIVNSKQEASDIKLQTATTRKLDKTVKRTAEKKMGGNKGGKK